MFGNIAPAYSMKPRRDPSHTSLSPGPGGYEASREFYRESSQYSFARAARDKQLRRVPPGPGHYSSHKAFFQEAPALSFSRSARLPKPKQIIPGPGSYETKPVVGQAPSALIPTKPWPLLKSETPGPGAYAPRWGPPSWQLPLRSKCVQEGAGQMLRGHQRQQSHGTDRLTIGYSFGTASRDQFKPGPSPGPGSYSSVFSGTRMPRASIVPRLNSVFKSVAPGPGSYDIPSTVGLAGLKAAQSARN